MAAGDLIIEIPQYVMERMEVRPGELLNLELVDGIWGLSHSVMRMRKCEAASDPKRSFYDDPLKVVRIQPKDI
jgi:hypothetical protein